MHGRLFLPCRGGGGGGGDEEGKHSPDCASNWKNSSFEFVGENQMFVMMRVEVMEG